MKKFKFLAMAAIVSASGVAFESCSGDSDKNNPFLSEYTTEFEIPPFDQIKTEHYEPAFKKGIEEAQADIQAIIDNPDAPTFENTIIALDNSGATLDRVSRVFYSLMEANSTPELVEIDEKVTPMVTKFQDEMMMNDKLFKRVKTIYDLRDSLQLNTAQKAVVEKYYKDFVRSGALLSDDDKAKLKEVNLKLADLYTKFNRNLLAANNEFVIFVDNKDRLKGIPEQVVANAAEEAKARGKEGQWAFTLHAPSRLPVLQYAADRKLREDMYKGYAAQASSGDNNNIPVIQEILKVRSQKAALLGFDNYAAYNTDNVMAKTPENAIDLLMKIWKPTVNRVNEEVAEMQAYADAAGDNIKIEPWDYYYYLDKVRQQKYSFDEAAVAPYFSVDSVRNGLFILAKKLYGVEFKELPDAPKYHPDVKVYEVLDSAGNHLAVFMSDNFTRPEKRQGAWMDELKSSYVKADGMRVRPIIYNVNNFAKPNGDTPSLLSIDDVLTMFHEFGHGLHGMLSKAPYKSISGTAVDRDFVELPSQINEHWALDPELLKLYAKHYKTGEVIPDELIAKIQESAVYGAGFALCERLSASYLDLKYGLMNTNENVDIMAFEKQIADELGMPSQVQYRYHSPYFKHIFGSDQYASGYYTYTWAEVLDTDGYELFMEKGVFDPATAKSFRENILEMGGSDDPMKLYVKFRGHEPSPDALLRHYGLDKPSTLPMAGK